MIGDPREAIGRFRKFALGGQCALEEVADATKFPSLSEECVTADVKSGTAHDLNLRLRRCRMSVV
jgi:hypothetical protein